MVVARVVAYGSTLSFLQANFQAQCALSAKTDPGNIVDYFPMQSLWTMDQYCIGNFCMQCWPIQINFVLVIFQQKDDFVLWPNIAQVIFVYIVVSDKFRQQWLEDMQCCPSMIITR